MREHTAADLLGRLIRIEGPVKKKPPTGHDILIIADDEKIENVMKIEMVILPGKTITAKLTLAHIHIPCGEDIATEVFETTDVEVRLSAYVDAVDDRYMKGK